MTAEEKTNARIEGMREALRIVELELDAMSSIQEGYMEAIVTGKHAGRNIPKRMARRFAHQFGERADVLTYVIDHIDTRILEIKADGL